MILTSDQPKTLANRARNRIDDIHGWDDPFCETVPTILGLAESEDLLSRDCEVLTVLREQIPAFGEDALGGIAGLKTGKERMHGQVFVGFIFVGFQRGVENEHEAGMRGECRGFGGHESHNDVLIREGLMTSE